MTRRTKYKGYEEQILFYRKNVHDDRFRNCEKEKFSINDYKKLDW